MSDNQLSLIQLYETAAHLGSRKSKINPKLTKGNNNKTIYTYKNGLAIIDLSQTKSAIESLEKLFEKIGTKKKQVLLVGTAKNLQGLVVDFSSKFSGQQMPHVTVRWAGGTLTNWPTIKSTLNSIENLDKILNDEKFLKKLSRNEILRLKEKLTKLQKLFGGLRSLKNNYPGAVLVLGNNPVAITEANKLQIPSLLINNGTSKSSPSDIVVCNHKSRNTVEIILERLVNAYNSGYKEGQKI